MSFVFVALAAWVNMGFAEGDPTNISLRVECTVSSRGFKGIKDTQLPFKTVLLKANNPADNGRISIAQLGNYDFSVITGSIVEKSGKFEVVSYSGEIRNRKTGLAVQSTSAEVVPQKECPRCPIAPVTVAWVRYGKKSLSPIESSSLRMHCMHRRDVK